MKLFHSYLKTPVGRLKLVADDTGLAAVLWENDRPARVPLERSSELGSHPVLKAASAQLEEYFAGTRRDFDVALSPRGTPFQRKVWNALARIPFGATRSYGELAREISKPSASRAVGMANGRNPISIIVPCHRVIGANGALTGFAGGLEAKKYLLAFESGGP
jgi:methylated-DNA-[protein]-cysteine S-methyltransferase